MSKYDKACVVKLRIAMDHCVYCKQHFKKRPRGQKGFDKRLISSRLRVRDTETTYYQVLKEIHKYEVIYPLFTVLVKSFAHLMS